MYNKTIIKERYEKSDHLLYPEMVRIINEAMTYPDEEIFIPDDFLDKKFETRSFLHRLITKIRVLALYIWLEIKSAFSSSYTIRFKAAVKKIIKAYDEKIETISKLANKSINAQDKAQYLKKEIDSIEELLVEKALQQSIINRIYVKKLEKKEDLLEKANRLQELTTGGFWSNLTHKNEKERLTNELLMLDPSFDCQQILTSLQSQCPIVTEISMSRNELIRIAEEIQRLQRLHEKLENEKKETEDENNRIIKSLRSITKIEDFIPHIDAEEEKIFEPHPPLSDNSSIDLESVQEQIQFKTMLQDIKAKTSCRDIALLWRSLLNNIPHIESYIDKWEINAHGNFILKLKKPLRLWIDTNDLKGGCIFAFGENTRNIVTGKLSSFHMAFDSGFDSHCIVRIALIKKKISPKIEGIIIENSSSVKVGGTFMGITKWNVKPYSHMNKEWKNKVQHLPDNVNYNTYLHAKYDL